MNASRETRSGLSPWAEVLSVIHDYAAARGRSPLFIVMDGATFLEACGERFGRVSIVDTDRARFAGVEVIVLPTDGIKMIRAVGAPAEEALRAQRPSEAR